MLGVSRKEAAIILALLRTTNNTSLLEVLLSYLSFSDISISIIVDFICLSLTGILNFTRNFCTAQVVELRHPVENEV
jgi:hypothetical protein